MEEPAPPYPTASAHCSPSPVPQRDQSKMAAAVAAVKG